MVVQNNSIKDYDIVYLVTVLCQDLKVCEPLKVSAYRD